jgi:hypothetical protein
LGEQQLAALLVRTGFDIVKFEKLDFDIGGKDPETQKEFTAKEKFYCILVTKQRPLDIK